MHNVLYAQQGTAWNDIQESYKYAKPPSSLWELDAPL